MHFLSYLFVSTSSIIIISGASSSGYDPNVSSLDDSSFWNVGSDSSQEADFLGSEQAGFNFLEPDSGFHAATFA